MGFQKQVDEFVLHNTSEEYTTNPDSVIIEYLDEGDKYQVRSTWRTDGFPFSNTENVYVEPENELYDMFETIFEELYDRVTTQYPHVTVSNLSISPNREHGTKNPEFCNEWDDEITQPYGGFMYIESETDITPNGEEFISHIIDQIEERFGDTVNPSDFLEINALFSDFHYCKLIGLNGNVMTDNPSCYYNVEDTETYLQGVSETQEEYEQLQEQDKYECYFRFDWEDGEVNEDVIPDSVKNYAENLMSARINSYVDVEGEYVYESESIYYSENGTTESTKFFIQPQFDPDEILD